MHNDLPVRGAPGGTEAPRGFLSAHPWLATFLVVAGAACGPDDGAQWRVVQDYLDRQAAWEAEAGSPQEILVTGSGTVAERFERAEALHGMLPDAAAAVAAAREIVSAGGPHTADAAEFLIKRTASPLGMRDRTRELHNAAGENGAAALARIRAGEESVWEALIAHVGPDWAVVEDYLAEHDAWFERQRAAAPEGDRTTVHVGMHGQPSAIRAVAAARAILDAGEAEGKAGEAVEFLARHTVGMPNGDRHLAAGARALRAQSPGFEDWPRVLGALDRARTHAAMRGGTESPMDEFYAEMAAAAEDPVLRAGARYYLAAGLARRANALMATPEDRAAHRERALEAATGLSAGVEEVTFDDPDPRPDAAARPPRTFAEAEADLLTTIRHATVGGTLPEWTGRRLDGSEEPLSAYRGRVVLVDFWATWCPPCIAVLPELRQLVSDLPADKFALLAISVDQELSTVTGFMEKEPMPWDNWHVGASSEITRLLDVRGFPTYLIVDADGTILFNGNGPFPMLRCMTERAVAGEDPNCSPADWMDAH
ncbi:MAG: TlpA disulfide reductase family protein [Acidobacteriota bacterium]|nr:TlpA disulfide reductase family protein [Acidobacteriota bacterium]